jgi:hypothetical protein
MIGRIGVGAVADVAGADAGAVAVLVCAKEIVMAGRKKQAPVINAEAIHKPSRGINCTRLPHNRELLKRMCMCMDTFSLHLTGTRE